ncbi:MAG: DNA gyrase subunit A, partial [Pseudomonadota bacterium]
MKRSYLDYAMSVIVSRALPDVRDGLKPVHRRILYAMKESGYDWNRTYRKSARIVGDVMGKYHPHGDSAIYDAMVRMAQSFSMRLPLIDGQGNFGSMDGDPPAAMRYTEARLAKAASMQLDDIDKDTVDFGPNYDDSTVEPLVLPAPYPNLLVNGAGGIAVGMATNIPPHNLGEVIDACCAYLDNPGITIPELISVMPGPDFPTGGIILGRQGIIDAFSTGRGSVVMRGKTHVEEVRKDREAIVITEVPYQVNKAKMLERIAEVVHEKMIDGIAELRDESDRDGVRVVVELKRDANSDVVLNQLFRFTQLQTSFGVNTLALNGGRPELMNIRDILGAFLDFREEVIRRRTAYELGKARQRAHILVGLAVAVANIDPIIELIRAAPDPVAAKAGLLEKAWPAGTVEPLIRLIDEPGTETLQDGVYRLSEEQARAILELRLQRLTGLERDKIASELDELSKKILEFLEILDNRDQLLDVLRTELIAIKDEFATPRRTTLEEGEFEQNIEALIQREDMVVTLSHAGYIKRTPLSTYRAQKRGGKGRAAMATRDEDFVTSVFVANTHTPLLMFTSKGMAFNLKVYQLPLGTPTSRGKAMVNILPLKEGETISNIMPMPEDEDEWGDLDVVFATSKGTVRRNKLSDFVNIKANGKIAMKLHDEDGTAFGKLVGVTICNEDDDLLLGTRNGRSLRCAVEDLRVFAGRNSLGVRGITLGADDEIVSISKLLHVDATPDERTAYLREAAARRRLGDEEEGSSPEVDENESSAVLERERFEQLAAREEFVLTVTEKGFGKRTSSYEYRVSNR